MLPRNSEVNFANKQTLFKFEYWIKIYQNVHTDIDRSFTFDGIEYNLQYC